MVTMNFEYVGGLRCRGMHGPSGTVLETDAPADNHGKAERFSPTDLMGAALASCIATTVGINANKNGWNVDGMKLQVTKEMSTQPPRRIVRLTVELWMPRRYTPEIERQIDEIARNCPVFKSLHPDIATPTAIHWPAS
jgi:putative redox protein